MTTEENSLLAERQKLLAERLDLGIDEPKRRILLVKEEAENFFARLDKINGEKNPIRAFTELQAEPRAERQNFAQELIDAKAYGEAIKNHENEYNKLIFRMRKDLAESKA